MDIPDTPSTALQRLSLLVGICLLHSLEFRTMGVFDLMFGGIWWYIKLGLCTLMEATYHGNGFASQGICTPLQQPGYGSGLFMTIQSTWRDYNKSSAMLSYCQYYATGQSCLDSLLGF